MAPPVTLAARPPGTAAAAAAAPAAAARAAWTARYRGGLPTVWPPGRARRIAVIPVAAPGVPA
ncbi:MAG: hypothetical protein ACHP9Z_34175, partial [Streptosporangiales bacterium]